MGVINFNILHSFEFEKLVRKILSQYLNQPLEIFPEGPDGGVDIASNDRKILCQVKKRKNITDVKKALEDEINNIKLFKDETYIFVISTHITSKKKLELEEMISEVHDDFTIITGNTLESLLLAQEYSTIFRSSTKLYYDYARREGLILNDRMSTDLNEFIDEISKKNDIYIETTVYEECLTIIQKNKALILTGSAGVGKTTTTEMLARKLISMKYDIYYSATFNFEDVRREILKQSDHSKACIILDDLLGHFDFTINKKQLEDLQKLIKFALSKKIIMICNTRSNILQLGYTHNTWFEKYLKSQGISQITVESKYNDKDKAFILCSHLYNIGLKKEDLKILKKDNYSYLRTLVNKKYFNPRKLEDVLRDKNLSLDEIFDEVSLKFENVNFQYDDAYGNLDDISKKVLAFICTFKDNKVEKKHLDKYFNDSYDLKKLEKVFIKSTLDGIISFTSPSVLEYIDSIIKNIDIENLFLFQEQYSYFFKNSIIEKLDYTSFCELPSFFDVIFNVINADEVIIRTEDCFEYIKNNDLLDYKNCILYNKLLLSNDREDVLEHLLSRLDDDKSFFDTITLDILIECFNYRVEKMKFLFVDESWSDKLVIVTLIQEKILKDAAYDYINNFDYYGLRCYDEIEPLAREFIEEFQKKKIIENSLSIEISYVFPSEIVQEINYYLERNNSTIFDKDNDMSIHTNQGDNDDEIAEAYEAFFV